MPKEKELRKEGEDPKIYEAYDELHYADKPGHRERTLGNELGRRGGHKKHWKKEDQNWLLSFLQK